jgi:hypothetical protein
MHIQNYSKSHKISHLVGRCAAKASAGRVGAGAGGVEDRGRGLGGRGLRRGGSRGVGMVTEAATGSCSGGWVSGGGGGVGVGGGGVVADSGLGGMKGTWRQRRRLVVSGGGW